MIRTAILTVSDKGSRGERTDTSVGEIRALLESGPFAERDYHIVPDEQAMIRAKLRLWADGGHIDLILTTGGTGLALRDRTPEATREVLEREVPGLAELMRFAGVQKNPKAALSRAVCGVRGKTLIVNLPGSPKGARESLEAILSVLPHAVDTITGELREAPEDWHQ
ncbi:MAG: MogA/MoaB family molybdenum cofactor biosynthesis protein [Deinococcota bacterium]|nr:MogA/MoaB family molybdenum cofactor biosynthesis protein [Deinococcota bacterium]